MDQKINVPNDYRSGTSLWEINGDIYSSLSNLFDPDTGVVNEETEEQIKALGVDREKKLRNCVRFYRNQLAEAEKFKAAEKDLKTRREAFENRAKSMLQYIDDQTDNEKDKGLSDVAGEIKWTKSTKCITDNPSKLPSGFYVIERKPITTDIKKVLIEEKKAMKDMADPSKFVSKFKGSAHLETTFNMSIK